MARPLPPARPRWSTLLALGAVVLGVHLWLLAGELPDSSAGPDTAPATPGRTSAPAATSPQAATDAPAVARPVTVSQVRWIVPTAAPAPAPAPAPPARPAAAVKPRPKPAPEPAQPVNTAAPAEVAVSADSSAPPPAAATAPGEHAAPSASSADTVAQAPAEPAAGQAAQPSEPAPAPARVPASARLAYEVQGTVKGLGYSAEGTLDWTVANGRFDARMSIRLPLLGSRVQTSTGQVAASGLLPERFADKARSERATHFDHEQRRIRFSSNAPEAELQAGAQDRLSVFLQLAARFNAAPPAAGQLIELQVAGTGSADRWRFRVGEEETLALPAGELRTRRLVRETRGPHDTLVELWLAPSLEHLPVRIRLEQSSGDLVDQRLSRLP